MSRIILDASFVRACPADGSWLRTLVDQGLTLAVIDALAFELCSANDPNQWAAAARKLAAVAEHVECWTHVSEMMRWEHRERRAFSEPANASLTHRFRVYIASGCKHPADPTAVSDASTQREVDSGSALFIAIDACLPLANGLSRTVRGRSRTDVESACHAFVNNPQNVRFVLDAGGGDAVFAGYELDDDWVAWHHAKWLLAAICEAARRRDSHDQRQVLTVSKSLLNRKHDGDYLISLEFADAIASNETGELQAFARWMYGSSKRFVTSEVLCLP